VYYLRDRLINDLTHLAVKCALPDQAAPANGRISALACDDATSQAGFRAAINRKEAPRAMIGCGVAGTPRDRPITSHDPADCAQCRAIRLATSNIDSTRMATE